jgi:glycosyltransferase involved in cell wall biosynthesis
MTGTHLFPYWLLRLFRIKVVLSLQCMLWPKIIGKRGLWKLVHLLDRGVRDGGLEVPPNDIAAYSEAVRTLAENRETYERIVNATYRLS